MMTRLGKYKFCNTFFDEKWPFTLSQRFMDVSQCIVVKVSLERPSSRISCEIWLVFDVSVQMVCMMILHMISCWWSYIWDHVDMYWLLVVEVTKLWLTKVRPYLNGTIKIRGGSSCFEVGLVPCTNLLALGAAYLRCPEQSGSLILCHAHTHTKAVKKFVFPHKMVTWPS